MKPSEPTPNAPDSPVITLIQRLKDGSVHPSTLTKDQRLACVEILYLEGYSPSQIAQIVDCSEKTVKRDLVEIYTKNALNPSPELARQIVGKMLMRSEAQQGRLMRLGRGSEGSVGERAQAEYLAWQVQKDTVILLQSLGYLPQRAQQVIGDFVHRLDVDEGSEASLEITQKIIEEIETVGQETGLDVKTVDQLKLLRQRIEQAKLQQEAQRLLTQQQNGATNPEESPYVN